MLGSCSEERHSAWSTPAALCAGRPIADHLANEARSGHSEDHLGSSSYSLPASALASSSLSKSSQFKGWGKPVEGRQIPEPPSSSPFSKSLQVPGAAFWYSTLPVLLSRRPGLISKTW